MNRLVLSTLTVLLATSATAPMAQAAQDKVFNLHEVRLVEFDQRNKSEEKSSSLGFHQLRLAAFAQRNKFGSKDPNFSMQTVRMAELAQRNKFEEKDAFNLILINRENRDYRNKAVVE